jgi:glycosyltransferase involved in cell wall biosynthesis
LKILVDAAILKPELGGIATYVAGVVAGLSACPGVEVCVVTSIPDRLDALKDVEVVQIPTRVRSFAWRVAWRERELAGIIASQKADLLLAPTIELPARPVGVPAIMVVHDLGPLQAPGLYSWKLWLRYAAGVGLACRRADHVVCVSNSTLLQLRATFGKISTPCSVIGEAGRELPPVARHPRRPPYVLTVGAMRPHKNIETLVRAMGSPALAGVELQLAGPMSGPERRLLDEWRASLDDPDRIVHRGFVDLPALAVLYAEAAVVALPSLWEGFGLSLLEAMRAGAPVLASSIAAHHEVGGDAAAYVDAPLSAEAWAQALDGLLSDPHRSGALERASRTHVEGISWTDIGKRLVKLSTQLVTEWKQS